MQAPAAEYTQRGLLTVAAQHRSRCGAPRAIPLHGESVHAQKIASPFFMEVDSEEHVSRAGLLRIDDIFAVLRACTLLGGPVPCYVAAMVPLCLLTTTHCGIGPRAFELRRSGRVREGPGAGGGGQRPS